MAAFCMGWNWVGNNTFSYTSLRFVPADAGYPTAANVSVCVKMCIFGSFFEISLEHLCYSFTIIKCFVTMKWLLGSSTQPFDSCNWYLQQEMLLWLSGAENLIELSRRHTQRGTLQRKDYGTAHTCTLKQMAIWISV